MKYFGIFLTLSIFLAPTSRAEEFEIQILNGQTREKKTFIGGGNRFDIPITNVKGWNKCFAMPIKKSKIYGKNIMRGELYCTASSGVSIGLSCVAHENSVDVVIQNLYSTKLKVESDEIFVDGYAEIALTCNYL